ncbi:MAG TPA: Rab family GTPase [Candidatus Acidoferrales bacterium]|nr:Rab family GTPase [Candidatus Acidoferrales bacterium]
MGINSRKVCMLGSFSVGKTSLVRRFIESIYSEAYHTTLGVKVDKKNVTVGSEMLTLVLWDIHGDDAFKSIRMSYLNGMAGYLLVVDGTRKQTLEDALALEDRVHREHGIKPSVLALNKCDLSADWEIDAEREAALMSAGRPVLRTSAKTGEAVEQAFLLLAQAILRK